MKQSWSSHLLMALAIYALSASTSVQAELKGTNATFYSWDDSPTVQTFQNSNSSIVLDGKWHPFFAALNFDNNAVVPSAAGQSNGVVSCSTTDTDGNGLVGTSTPWAGSLRLSVDHSDTGLGGLINGFRETRCWELAVCDRQGDGTGSFEGADLDATPRYRRFAIDITDATGVCPTPTANSSEGYVNPTASNGFITLLDQDVPGPCAQTGRCDLKIDTDLYITLDRDCDGFIDDNDGAQVNNDPAEGDLGLIGSGGAGRIPLPVGNNDPQLCFFSEGKKPDFLLNPQWTGNIQARITAPVGGSGDKTVNHSIINSPVLGDVGDLPNDDLGDYLADPNTPNPAYPVFYPTATHVTNAFASNPFIGSSVDNDTTSYFTPGADGDDLNLTNDELGVILPPDSTSDNDGSNTIYTATVAATNPTAVDSQLCGWFDFNQDGSFDNGANPSTTGSDPDVLSTSVDGERSCILVPAGTSSTNYFVSWSIPANAQDKTGDFYFRFRISNDPDMFDTFLLSSFLGMDSGEVHDQRLQTAGTLPVSISSFDSSYTDKGLELSWVTVSETQNLGFYVWGDKGNGLEPLSVDLVPSEEGDPATPRAYSMVLPGLVAGDVFGLAVTAVDYRGKEEVYGLFEVGASYGKKVTPAVINWDEVRQQIDVRDQLHGAAAKRSASVSTVGSGGSATPDYVDIRVTEPGLQEITWQMLADAGMDLTGVSVADITITLKGEPVSRHMIDTNQRPRTRVLLAAERITESGLRFGPGGKIRFWGTAPSTADSIYVDHYVYRVSVVRGDGLSAGKVSGRESALDDSHLNWLRQDIDTGYQLASQLDDPWYAARLRADRENVYTTQFFVDDALRSEQPARLEVLIAGLTDFPESPDHRALVEVNGQVLGESIFDGQAVRLIDLELPPGLLVPGENTVRVLAPGGTAAPFDLFLVDTLALGYPRDLIATDGRLLVENPAAGTGLRVAGLNSRDAIAYGWDGEALFEIEPGRASAGSLSISTLDAGTASYWISSADRVIRPDVIGTGTNASFFSEGETDLLVIAHPAFMPVSASETHPLNDYIRQRESEGWTVGVHDIADIQAAYGHGMPLPEAVTAFLRAADHHFEYEHVLLVGGDSYDYTDNLGLGSVSFIPTRYAPTSLIPHTPSDALMGDLDGDGLADKAIGRWPVRTQGDLAAIVSKTLAWPTIANPSSSVWLTDSEDSDTGSFNRQADRVLATLENAGWPSETLNRVYFNQTVPRPGLSVADSARGDLFDLLEQGRALTGFVGHGAPTTWSFQGMVTPGDVSDLHNEGNPTMIGTMTCYTSYFVSPAGDSVAHRWMNGYREDAAGDRIPGVANGAAAIHGAATLADYRANETFMQAVLEAQLSGATIGQAVEAARRQAQTIGNAAHVVNWTLLGDPTLKLQ